MAIIEFREASDDLEISTNEDQVTELTRSFVVRCDGPTAEVAVFADPRCPKLFSSHPRFPKAYARLPRVRGSHGGRIFKVTVNYSTNVEEADEAQRNPNPLERPPKVSFSLGFDQVPALHDIDGKPIANTAGDRLAGAVRDEIYGQIRVTRNYPEIPSWVDEYRKDGGAINSDSPKIDSLRFEEETLKLTAAEFSEAMFENGVKFKQASFTITALYKPWYLYLLNEGFREKKEVLDQYGSPSITDELVPIIIGGKETSDPVFLAQEGDHPLKYKGRAYRKQNPNYGSENRVSGEPEFIIRTSDLTKEEIKPLEFKIYKKLPYRKLIV